MNALCWSCGWKPVDLHLGTFQSAGENGAVFSDCNAILV
jgi:hypothetical protein